MTKKIKSIMLDWEQYQISSEDENAIKKDTTWTTAMASKIWIWTKSEFEALINKEDTNLYYIIDGEAPVPPTPTEVGTITLTYTESDTNSAFVHTYSDEAAGWESGSDLFDQFFWYKPVLLNAAGVETAELNPNDYTKDINGNSVNITSGDNVMIKFPTRGIKMSKNGREVTISLTKERNKEWYQYYAFSRGTIESPQVKDAFYIWAYEMSYNSNSVGKSWSGATVKTSQTHKQFIDAARKNDNNSGLGGYDTQGYFQHMYLTALYMMKYCNGNSQTTFWQGIVSDSAMHKTGETNTRGMNYGSQDKKTAIKMFGIENIWWNSYQFVDGVCSDSNLKLCVALQGFTGDITTSGNYYNTNITIPSNSGNLWFSSIAGNNLGMFAPQNTNTSGTTYNDYSYAAASRLLCVFGYCNSGAYAGAFRFALYDSASHSDSINGSRLMYIN